VRDFDINAGLTDTEADEVVHGHRNGAAFAGIQLRFEDVPVQDLAAEPEFMANQGPA